MTAPPVAVGEDQDWLVRQLEVWPTRVDPEKTTNIEFLMKRAATEIAGLKLRVGELEGALNELLDAKPGWRELEAKDKARTVLHQGEGG